MTMAMDGVGVPWLRGRVRGECWRDTPYVLGFRELPSYGIDAERGTEPS